MAPGLPVRMVILCAVLTGGRITHAEGDRRKVAVIDLSGDPAASALRQAFYNELLSHWALRPLDTPATDASLQGPLLDEDKDRIDRARRNREAADAAFADFNYQNTRTEALQGQSDLAAVTPTAVSIALYAELELALAVADFNLHTTADMKRELALVARLDRKKELDQARFVPELIEAYEAARKPTPNAMLEVKGEGHVWLDGIEVGLAPQLVPTTVGKHLVQITGADRQTAGVALTVPGPPVEFPPAPASEELKIRRARLALSRVPDAAARAAAMKHLGDLLGVHDAVLISKNDDGKLVVQTWRDREPGFSAIREHRNEQPVDLLAPLSPPRRPEVEKPIPFVPPPIVVEKPWYAQRWVQGSFATGALAAIVGTILWVRRDRFTSFNGNVQSADPPGIAK